MHAVGSGAYGTFTVTNPEAARWTRMDMFSEAGKQTDVFVRFSTVARSIDHFRKADATYGSHVEEAVAAARI